MARLSAAGDIRDVERRIAEIQAGFDRAVNVTHILARDTIDEDVMERRVTKRTVQETLLAAMKRRRKQ